MSLPSDHRTRIKICGLTREADVIDAVQAGADAIGFVLYEKSPRYVSAQRAKELAALLPPFVTPVLLFVNASASLLQAAREAVPHAVWQFHGDELPSDCAILVDAHVEGYGGGGQVFDWSLLPQGLSRPMILSGGLHPGNVMDGVKQVRPWAVDVSSGVEAAKGIKDAQLMRQFCQAVRAADRQCAEAV